MNKLAKAGIIVIAIALPVYLASTFMISSQSYLTVTEVISGDYKEKEVSVIGRVLNKPIMTEDNKVLFNITDGLNNLPVYFEGSMNFSDMDEVVVMGIYIEAEGIEAQDVLTGCTSTYKGSQSSIFQDPIILFGLIIVVSIFAVLFLLELIRKKYL